MSTGDKELLFNCPGWGCFVDRGGVFINVFFFLIATTKIQEDGKTHTALRGDGTIT